jgi:hypothetical protein
MKKVHENLIVIDETAVELYLLKLYFFFGSLLLAKDAHPKLTVVHVASSKNLACGILDNFFYFDVGILMAAKFFVEDPLFCNHVMLGDV